MAFFIDDDGNIRDSETGKLARSGDGTPYYGNASLAQQENPQDALQIASLTGNRINFNSYDVALNAYKSGKVEWNYNDIASGLSNRDAFNLNAIWGGTQYGTGRVSAWSHLDPTQLQANQIAGSTRDELWNTYNELVSQGHAVGKNPDQIALELYRGQVGEAGANLGYGADSNTMIIAETIKSQFLNQPEIFAATGQPYAPSPETIAAAQRFGEQRKAGLPTWQTFEQQGMGGDDWFSKLLPVAIAAVSFNPLAASIGSTFGVGATLSGVAAGSVLGGTTALMSDQNFLKGALTGGITGGLAGAYQEFISGAGAGGSGAVDTAINMGGADMAGGDAGNILAQIVGAGGATPSAATAAALAGTAGAAGAVGTVAKGAGILSTIKDVAQIGGAVVGGITSVVGTAAQIQAGKDQSAALQAQASAQQQQANALQEQYAISKKLADIQNVRAIRQQLRERYRAGGALTARGAVGGTLGSSGYAGGMSSLGAQLSSNLSYMSDTAGLQAQSAAQSAAIGQAKAAYGAAAGDAAAAQGRGAMGAAFATLGETIFSKAGGFDTIFKRIG